MLPENDDEAVNLLGLSLLFTLLTTTLSAVLIVFAGKFIPIWLNEPAIAPYLWFIPVSVLFGGSFTAFNYWNSRTKKFGRLSIAQIIRSLGTSTTKLGAGLLGFTSSGVMIGATVLGQIIASTVLGGQIWRDDRHFFRQHITWRGMLAGGKRYHRFPLFTTWSALLNSASWQLPAFFLTFYFSPVIVGYYALGNRILSIPMSLLGRSIGQVFFQRASEAKNEGMLALVVENTFARLVRMGLFPSLMLTFIGKDLFVIAFGPEWAEAGVYVQILSVWTFFWFISSPLSTLFSILERQDLVLFINILIFISRLAVLIFGGYFLKDARLTIALFGVSGILVYGYLNFLLLHYSGVKWNKIGQILFVNFKIATPTGIMMGIINWLNLSSWVTLGAGTIIIIIYFLFVIQTDPEIKNLINKNYSKND